MTTGYAVYHEMGYAGRQFQRGEYAEIEYGLNTNDRSLINIGYLVEHDASNLTSCLRCSRRFVSENFLRMHETKCPMSEVDVGETSEPETEGEPSSETTEVTAEVTAGV